MRIRRKHIRDAAIKLIEEHGIDEPWIDVRAIAKDEGFQIVEVPGKDEMSGFLDRRDGSNLIGVNTHHPENRKRFTLGHELGHAYLHGSKSLYFDDRLKFRNRVSSEGSDLEEIEANLFAAELLMPATFLQADFESIPWFDIDDEDEIERLANRYKVSPQALTIRLGYLRLP